MLDLIRQGGGPMLFVMVFGALTIGAAGLFALRGDRRRLGFIIWMGVATAFSVAGGVASDLAAVGHHGVERCAKRQIDPVTCFSVGFAESMAPAIMGFTVLSLAAMLVAVGMSRTARAQPLRT